MKTSSFKRRPYFAASAVFFAAVFAGQLLSCAATSPAAKTVDPAKAVTELAPVTRLAAKPAEGVYYSLFVRSFADSNGDGIGDFNGITAKLDYLNDGNDLTTSDLGITGIWLLPIFPSPSYHGYDVDDYYNVNPDYGTMEDFENMLAECKKRGISVIIDMTCNHSSTYNDWFKASRDPNDPHHDWYRWAKEGDARYNLKQQMWGHDLWNEDFKNKGYYYAGLFGKHMPEFNLDNKELRAEFKKVMKFWFDKGVSGFRYDAAGHIYNRAELAAGEESASKAVAWWKEIIDYNKSVYPDQYSLGEVWENNAVRAQYVAGLGSCFHFDIGDKYIADELKYNDAGKNTYANMLESDLGRYARSNPDYIDAPFLSNHDQPRVGGVLRGDTAKLKTAAAMYLLSEGVPFIYYGEELGMKSGTKDETKRTPMLWNTSNSAGKPKDKMQTTWAAASDCIYNKKTLSVAEQEKDPSSLLEYYKRLIRVKTAHPALFKGRLHAIDTGAAGISSWAMVCDTERAFVMHNLSKEAVTFSVPADYADLAAVFVSGTDVAVNGSQITIPSLGTVVLAGN